MESIIAEPTTGVAYDDFEIKIEKNDMNLNEMNNKTNHNDWNAAKEMVRFF